MVAASAQPGALFSEILPWLVALLVLVVIGAVVVTWLRRSLRAPRDAGEGFTLHDLRQMHADGALSDEEFERAKAAMIGRVTAAVSENTAKTATDSTKPTGNREPTRGNDDHPDTSATGDA